MPDTCPSMDVGAIAILVAAAGFVLLVLLAIRRMARGSLHEGSTAPEALEEDAPPTEEEPFEPRSTLPSDASVESSAMVRGLAKTRQGLIQRINQVLFGKKLDASLVDELESVLITSDIGIRTTEKLLDGLRTDLSGREIGEPSVVKERLRSRILEATRLKLPPISWETQPTVMMVIGVNGVGKTTTIGKLASRFRAEGKKVVLAAGDTFRAAAVEQLEVWGQRSGAEVVRGTENQDPASVVYEAIQQARRHAADICICDTAGRLHTKVTLMEELRKLRRVMGKALPGAPHEVLMVLDATTGQNGIAQARQFKEAVEVNAIALTKLDGTAKGGVVVAICEELALPVRYIGIGEGIEDLRDFDAEEFVDALFAESSPVEGAPSVPAVP